MTNLQSLALTKNASACHFMSHADPIFKELHNVLNNISKKLLSDGIGAEKKQARVVTEVEENILWEKRVMGLGSPMSLQNAVFFLLRFILLFARRI